MDCIAEESVSAFFRLHVFDSSRHAFVVAAVVFAHLPVVVLVIALHLLFVVLGVDVVPLHFSLVLPDLLAVSVLALDLQCSVVVLPVLHLLFVALHAFHLLVIKKKWRHKKKWRQWRMFSNPRKNRTTSNVRRSVASWSFQVHTATRLKSYLIH